MLGDDALQVVLADESEQAFPVTLDVVAVEKPFAPFWYDGPQTEFAGRKRQITQVFAVPEAAPFLLVI